MKTEEALQEILPVCPDAKEYTEQGRTYILLPALRLPNSCTPKVVDALLCLSHRDGYDTRLYFAQRVSCRNNLNWNAQNVPILQRTWFAYSWRVAPNDRPIEVLAQHLKALQ